MLKIQVSGDCAKMEQFAFYIALILGALESGSALLAKTCLPQYFV